MKNESSLWDEVKDYFIFQPEETVELPKIHPFEIQRRKKTHEAKMRQEAVVRDAKRLWDKFKDNQNFNMFLGLYRLKGSKTSRSFASIQSKDVENIKFAYNWFKMLSKGKIGAFIYCFPRGKKRSMEFWQNAVKADQYYIYDNLRYNVRNKNCMTYLHGSCRIQVNDTDLKNKLDYWMGMFDQRCEDLTKNIH